MIVIDLLAAGGGNIATELFERTSSTPRVREALELSLAPAFLLVGIGSMMNVMMQRLVWLANRIERLCINSTAENPEFLSRLPFEVELDWLTKRRRFARTAIKFSTGAAVVISIVIALLFVSAFIETKVGVLVAFMWVLSVGMLLTGLAYFLREALMAAAGPQDKEPK
ncbi:MAG: DUF2721 domain-containing protein [Altererythrobacter sp.]|uniref:DUF2721 domain-containing protein n=1 Tax=uncultured Altererythrobacter sp. TaxID=500840 RepID=UPI001846293B|nr:DUF2721 domain-containing protein [uncultured Altererythrobacter sp.]NNE50721.1 DUF2721 domain-containing protein [Altererythrobacter sp.]NNF94601.1 DUF2721 domain-containing protein [Altererythrobacter sp.]NNK45335.1 DUF2721 domain-containing protein [Altererythrobacter sp.]